MMEYMTDDQVTPTVNPPPAIDPNGSATTPPATPAGQTDQDPLAILENILQDAKKKSEQKATGSDGQPAPSDGSEGVGVEPSEVEIEEVKQAALEAEAAHNEQYEAERQRQIAEQQALIQQQLPQTPQFQAWQQQRAEAEDEKAQASSAGEGYEIEQLSQTKIPVPDSQTVQE